MADSANNTSPIMQMSQADIFMVAERAVQQHINDLRGEVGVRLQTIENVVAGLQNNLSANVDELKEDFAVSYTHLTLPTKRIV